METSDRVTIGRVTDATLRLRTRNSMPKAIAPFDCSQLPELSRPSALVAGIDEVGRGAIFGPVVAAVVVVPMSELAPLIAAIDRDSKQFSAKRRSELAGQIREWVGEWRIGYATAAEIDRLNILQASLLAMKRAIAKLKQVPDFCLVDGRFTIPELSIPQQAIVQGDARSPAIGAASILAKVWRDELIARFASKYPAYQLDANKGYPTAGHRLALRQYGLSPQHRRSFRPCRI